MNEERVVPRVRICSGVMTSSHVTWVRRMGVNPPPGVGGRSGRCTSPERMMRVSRCTHGIDTSIWFHTMPSVPPGVRIRAASRPASSESTQCQDWANTTISNAPSGSPVSSATPPCHVTPGIDEAWARIASEGSTASTTAPARARSSLILPVPAPMSATRSGANEAGTVARAAGAGTMEACSTESESAVSPAAGSTTPVPPPRDRADARSAATASSG